VSRGMEPPDRLPIRLPIRLIDQAVDPSSPGLAEAQASVHAAASALPKLSERAHVRIRNRLRSSVARERSPRARMWIAVAFAVAMMVSGAVGATVGSAVTSWLAQSRAAKKAVPSDPTPERRRNRPPAKPSVASPLPSPSPSTSPSPSSSSPSPATPAALPSPETTRTEAVLPTAAAETRGKSLQHVTAHAPVEERGKSLQHVAAHVATPARTPPFRQALPSPTDVESLSPPKPGLVEAPFGMPKESPAVPSGTTNQAVAPSGMPEPSRPVSPPGLHGNGSVATAFGPRPVQTHASPAASGQNEAAILGEAMRLLRVRGNPQAALALLDGGGPALKAGAFGPEVAALRIEVLLALGRTGAALDDLERLPVATLPRAAEWLVVRAELRGKGGRWRAAEEDFAAALATRGALKPELEERALWGRAVVRLHQGNAGGARSDAEDYLRRFPDGRFRGAAEKAVAPAP
jgi:hypothetical protein